MHLIGERNRNSRGFCFRDGRDASVGKSTQPEPVRFCGAKTALMCAIGGIAFAATLLVKLVETAT